MSNISRGNTDYVDFVHFAEAKCHLFRGNAGLFVCETVVLSVFRCKFHQNLYWLTIWWWLWWKISNISRGNTNYVDFYHFAEAQCHSFRGPAGLFVTAASARSRQVFLWDWDCDADGVTVWVVVSVARFWQAFTATFAENHGHFRIFHAQLSKNLHLHDISKHSCNIKKHNVWWGILSFFKFLLYIFGLHKFSKLNYLTVTHGHFHRINFSTQIIIIYGRFWVI
jgi:hypothetical protein